MDLTLLGDCLTSLFETTTPSGSPLHRGKDGCEKVPRCNNAAHPPPVQGGVRGGS